MPGFTLIYKKDKSVLEDFSFNEINKSLQRTDFYPKKLYASEDITLFMNSYEEYPFFSIQCKEFVIFIEGMIYNQSEIELENTFKNIIHNFENRDYVKSELEKLDGEFIIIFINKNNNEVCIFNDIFARLPSYYYENDEIFIFSRELLVIYTLAKGLKIDLIGFAFFLCFGYTINERTLYQKCKYLLPGSILKIQNKSIINEESYVFDFERMIRKISFSDAVIELTEAFTKACYDRTLNNEIYIGLSGGLDSRLLAAHYKNYKKVTYLTRLSVDQKEKNELIIAQQLAKDFGLNHSIIDGVKSSLEDIIILLLTKGGLNSLENGFNLNYETEIKKHYGRQILYLTGDGGDRIKPHIKFSKKLKEIDELIEVIFQNNSKIPIEIISKALQIDKHKIIDDLREYLLHLPEESYYYKYIHFMIYESAFKYVFEGEDRKREFFWASTPFYQTDFFIKAMSVPEIYKKDYKLYTAMFKQKDIQFLKYKNESWNFPLNSGRFKVYIKLKKLRKILPKSVVRKLKNQKKINHDNYLDNLSISERYIKEKELLKESGRVLKILAEIQNHSSSNFWRIMTPFILDLYFKDRTAALEFIRLLKK